MGALLGDFVFVQFPFLLTKTNSRQQHTSVVVKPSHNTSVCGNRATEQSRW